MTYLVKPALIGIIASSLLAGSAMVRAGDGWSVTLEPERERVRVSGGNNYFSDSLALSVAYRQGAEKYDFKVEADKDHDAAAAASGKVEARYRHYFDKLAGIEPSVRVSIGDVINSGSDFAFYTIQPKLAYELGNGWEPYFSVRFRDSFDRNSHPYQTWTYYLGAACEFGQGWEIEPSVFTKTGVEKTNGVKLELTKSF